MSEQRVFAAAEEAKSLSELLKKKKLLGRDGLRWLDHRQIDKFHKAINKTESSDVFRIAQSWPSSRDSKYGFMLLDWLWLIGPKNDHERSYLSISSSPGYGRGRILVARLALFQPEWVAKWWRWRCETGRRHIHPENPLERIIVNTISEDEFRTHCTELPNEVVGKIIGLRPELIDHVPRRRWGQFLQTALEAQL